MVVPMGMKNAEFSFLPENIKTTKDNLSFQMNKLREAGYIKTKNSFKGNYTLTTGEIIENGIAPYVRVIHSTDVHFKHFRNIQSLST